MSEPRGYSPTEGEQVFAFLCYLFGYQQAQKLASEFGAVLVEE